MEKISVMIVDDSRVIREVVSELLKGHPQIEVVGMAEDPIQARSMIKELNPDVLTLDIEMPKMDGITFLKNLMRLRPMPVVMMSTLTQKGADITLDALSIGAVDFIAKPNHNLALIDTDVFKAELVSKIKLAAKANKASFKAAQSRSTTKSAVCFHMLGRYRTNQIFAIGASTGGTEAITSVLTKMPKSCPPIVISQHIPENFSLRFANRVNNLCEIEVVQAQHNEQLKQGVAYIAPGGLHLEIVEQNGKYFCQLSEAEKVNRHRPSVDVMYESLVPVARNVQAILLTGMGNDGANGMRSLQAAGAHTIIQSKRSSLIWGMPGSAAKLNAHDIELDLEDIPEYILTNVTKKSKAS